MNVWRLELLRLIRTRRWIALFGIYLFFGFLGPFTARYLNEILARTAGQQGGLVVELPPPTPHDGIAQYVSNVAQLGVLVVVVIAAGAFFMTPEIATFLRTRVERMSGIMVPKYLMASAGAIAAFLLGSGAAWYETEILLGNLPISHMLAGIGYGVLSLLFVVAVVAAVSARATSMLSTVLISIVALLLLPILGLIKGVNDWLPTSLVSAMGPLAGGAAIGDYVKAAVVAIVMIAMLLVLAVRGHASREI